jgi:hypothetical protein
MNVYIEGNDIHSTLTTWLYTSYWQAYAALQQGHVPYFNWYQGKFLECYVDKQKYSQIPNAYEWYFIQPYSIDKSQPKEIRTWNTDTNTGLFPLMSEPLNVIKNFYKKHLIFNAETNARGEAIRAKYNIDFSKTIGITWRGTDIYLDGRPRIPIEVYFKFIDEILEKNPDFRIAATAEEEKILDPLFALYPQAFLIEEFYQAPNGGKSNPERFSPRSGYERGLQPALMVWLFSKCSHYIKNRSSAAAVASWLSDGKIYSLGHPETLGFFDGGKPYAPIVEIEGVQYPMEI